MMISFAIAAVLFQSPSPGIAVPANAHAVYTTEARGVQIYRCNQDTAGYRWAFQAPEATLFDAMTNLPQGIHEAGPTWTWKDGSSISGTVVQNIPAADPSGIPWLLLATKPNGAQAGALTLINFVSRSATSGGGAPGIGCDAEHRDAVIRVPYTATYTFYAVASVPLAASQDTH